MYPRAPEPRNSLVAASGRPLPLSLSHRRPRSLVARRSWKSCSRLRPSLVSLPRLPLGAYILSFLPSFLPSYVPFFALRAYEAASPLASLFLLLSFLPSFSSSCPTHSLTLSKVNVLSLHSVPSTLRLSCHGAIYRRDSALVALTPQVR